MIKYIIGLFLATALVWSLIPVQAELSLYHSLIYKIGVLRNQQKLAQYANVTYCGKTVSVTANHVGGEIAAIVPNAVLIAVSRDYDIAIYEKLGLIDASPLASILPNPFDDIYIPTFVWMNDDIVVYKYSVLGYNIKETLVQGILFFGASGSGVYNKDGEYLGPALSLQPGPGFDRDTKQHSGIIGIGRTDKLIELFTKEVCGK